MTGIPRFTGTGRSCAYSGFIPRLSGHLVGLNLNRAWTMRGVASVLEDSDPRKKVLLESASLHERAGMKDVWSGSYEGEHWLGSFATYLKTDVGVAPQAR